MIAQGVNAGTAVVFGAPVHGVDFPHGPVYIDKGISGDAYKVHFMLLGVNAADHDGVGVAVTVVVAHEKNGINAVLPLGVKGQAGILLPGLFALSGGNGLRRRRHRLQIRGAFPEHVKAEQPDKHHSQHADKGENDSETAFFPVFHSFASHFTKIILILR